MTISILGTGWLGSALFKTLVEDREHRVFGSSRNSEKREELLRFARQQQLLLESERDVVSAMQSPAKSRHKMFALSAPDFKEADSSFFLADVLVLTIPPNRRLEAVVEQYAREIDAIVRLAEQQGVQHLIYTSSTSVYGNVTGLVDETMAPAPETDSAKAVLAAEERLTASSIPVTILRLAGLYGPDRHPGRWMTGKVSLPNADAPVNLVHQSAVVAAIEKVIEYGPPKKGVEVFNVCAAAHPSKKAFYTAAIVSFGGVVPEMLAGGAMGKQVESNKIRRALNWQPREDELSFV